MALLVADVMGHGVSAAMLTGVVKSAFRASSPDGYEPRAMVRRLWNNMDAFGSERFVTLIAAVVSLDERRVDYVNAGHPCRAAVQHRGVAYRLLASSGPLVSPAFARVHVGTAERLLRTTAISFFCTPTECRTHWPARTI